MIKPRCPDCGGRNCYEFKNNMRCPARDRNPRPTRKFWTVVMLCYVPNVDVDAWTEIVTGKYKTKDSAVIEARLKTFEKFSAIERLNHITVIACFRGELENHL